MELALPASTPVIKNTPELSLRRELNQFTMSWTS